VPHPSTSVSKTSVSFQETIKFHTSSQRGHCCVVAQASSNHQRWCGPHSARPWSALAASRGGYSSKKFYSRQFFPAVSPVCCGKPGKEQGKGGREGGTDLGMSDLRGVEERMCWFWRETFGGEREGQRVRGEEGVHDYAWTTKRK